MSIKLTASLLLATTYFTHLASAHGYIHDIRGTNNITANGFLVEAAQIVNGSQANAAVITSPQGCGVNVAAGAVDPVKQLDLAAAAGLPSADANGTISMVWRQVNGGPDGAGPGTAEYDPTGTGQNFTAIHILRNFGDGGSNSDQLLTIQLPPGTNCTSGTLHNACLIRVTGGAGPFGSCLAVGSSPAQPPSPSPTPPSKLSPSAPVRPAASGKRRSLGAPAKPRATSVYGRGATRVGSAWGRKRSHAKSRTGK